MFIGPKDTLWTALLENTPHDVYHLPGYATIEAGLLNGEAIAWVHREQGNTFLIPLVSRTINGGQEFRDLVSPYGYSGMLTLNSIHADEASHALSLFNKEAAANGYVSSFLRLNPLLNSWQLPQTESWRQWFHGGTVSVNLSQPVEEIRGSFHQNHRRNLQRLHTSGYTAAINQWAELPQFMAAYRQTMKRRQAHPYYFFPDSYFQALHQLLGARLVFISIMDADGEFAAGGLFTLFDKVMQYHLGATTNKHLYFSPSKLMMDAAIEYGIAKRADLLHLGGGLGGSTTDGLFRFKKGFAEKYHPYTSLRFIHLPAVYEKLKLSLGKGYNRNTYFPEYRVIVEE
jgi:hypothetical protein